VHLTTQGLLTSCVTLVLSRQCNADLRQWRDHTGVRRAGTPVLFTVRKDEEERAETARPHMDSRHCLPAASLDLNQSVTTEYQPGLRELCISYLLIPTHYATRQGSMDGM
jgi:hypothetical protein